MWTQLRNSQFKPINLIIVRPHIFFALAYFVDCQSATSLLHHLFLTYKEKLLWKQLLLQYKKHQSLPS